MTTTVVNPDARVDDTLGIAQLHETFALQRAAFARDLWPALETRRERLRAVAAMILARRADLTEALMSDYAVHPAAFGDVVEILGPIGRCLHAAERIDAWAADDVRSVDPAMFGTGVATSRYAPKGVVGNIVPWNFPFEIGFGPLAEMLGAGNRVIIKPSDLTPACARLTEEMVGGTFDRDLVSVARGGLDLARAFSAMPWDHLLYTGNPEVGREVAGAAARNLTPVTLELGGKCPTVMLPGASTPEAVRNVIGTKLIKNGQVCISVDHVLVPRTELERFVTEATTWLSTAVPDFATSPDCVGIITTRHLARQRALLQEARDRGVRVVSTGAEPTDPDSRQMALTLVIDPPADLALMREEIFGPLLPVIPYDAVDEAVDRINAGDRPLALYVFGDVATAEDVLRRTISGSAGINVCAMQANNDTGFGGSGTSGYGRHHGIEGFREFSMQRGTFVRGEGDLIDAFLPPYRGTVEVMVEAAFAGLSQVLAPASPA